MPTSTASVAARIWDLSRVRALIVLVAVALGAVGGAVLSSLDDESYTASAALFVSAQSQGGAEQAATAADFASTQAVNFAALATSQVVLQPVIEQLGLDTNAAGLRTSVRTSVEENTSIISVTATDPSADRAAEIANAVSESLVSEVEELASPSGAATLTLTPVDVATAPAAPSSPSPLVAVVLGMLVGLCVGGGIVALINAFARSESETA
jgi:polysaccharide biosynthesis transport protein